MAKQTKRQPTDEAQEHESHIRRNTILTAVVFIAILAVFAVITWFGHSPDQPPPSNTEIPPTVNPTLKAKINDWARQSMVFKCPGGDQIIYLGIVTPIADQRAGYTLWQAIPAGTTTDDLLKSNLPQVVKTEVQKIGDASQYRAMIVAVLINYTISDLNTVDWIHQKQLNGYADALCWSVHNQDLINTTWQLDSNQQETLLDGLAFISAIHGQNPDETLALYKTLNVTLNPTTAKSAHWVQNPWSSQDEVSCEMLDFINWLSRRSIDGIVFSPNEPARTLIRPGGLPFQQMKCTHAVVS